MQGNALDNCAMASFTPEGRLALAYYQTIAFGILQHQGESQYIELGELEPTDIWLRRHHCYLMGD